MNTLRIKINDIIIWILYLCCLLAGYIGFSQYYNMTGELAGFWGKIYNTLQLFVFQSSFTNNNIPTLLNITRFIAPVLLAGTILNLFFSTVFNRTNLFIIKHSFRDHVIFCGLSHKSFLLIQDYLNNYQNHIVVIEKNPDNLLISNLKNKKIRYVFGNAENPEILEKANIRFASAIFVLTGNDKANIHITQIISDIYKQKNIEKFIKIILHISDHSNMQIFKEFQERKIKNIDFHAFNIYQKIASVAVNKYRPDQSGKYTGTTDPPCHILVHGMNRLGEQIVLESIQLYHFANLRKLKVTLIDNDIERKALDFRAKFPLIDNIADITFKNHFELINYPDYDVLSGISLCFICGETESQNYQTAKQIRQIFFKMELNENPLYGDKKALDSESLEEPRIIILMPADHDILNLFENFNVVSDYLHIECFDSYANVCKKQMIADEKDLTDNIAMQIHNIYLGLEEAELMKSWENLTEREKDFNRYPARHLAIKLQYLNVKIVPIDQPGEIFEISKIPEDKLLTLAKMEHNRWMAEKILGGYMPVKEMPDTEFQSRLKINLGLHKDMQEWEELSEADRNKDSIMTDNIKLIVRALGGKLVKI